MTYPLSLNVEGRRVLVVGGGTVGTRRARALVEAGADVVVVAPEGSKELADLARDGFVEWHQRAFVPADMNEVWLVHAATNDSDTNQQIAALAESSRIWCVRADDAEHSAAWTPSVARVDGVTVAITSDGDPGRSRALRSAMQHALSQGDLPLRRTRAKDGSVVLIGGGPGDPDLISVRGLRELRTADVVVTDRLAPRSLLDLLDDDVEIIEAGKGPDKHTLNQTQINNVIVEKALEGKRVARLKGGDPFVLGRGSEELAACVAAGVPVEVVPGITSAISAPAAAGIPVTHRGITTGFAMISGHELPDFSLVAQLDLTLVMLMGVARIAELSASLISNGRSASTPVAIIESAWLPEQRTTIGTLETIASIATARDVRNPAVIVVGEVVKLSEDPLLGLTTDMSALATFS